MVWAWFKSRRRKDSFPDSGSARISLTSAVDAAPTAIEFAAAPVGLASVDLQGQLQTFNAAFTAVVGRDAAQLAGSSLHHLIYPADDLRFRDALQRLLDGVDVVFRGELRLLHIYGYAIWVRAQLRLQRDAQQRPQCLLLAIDDISEQRRNQELAALSEQRFQRVVENLPAVIWILAPDLSRVLYVNEAYETVWGQARETLYANPLGFFDLVHPEDVTSVAQVYSGGEREWEINYRILRADGEMRHLRDIGRGVFDERGELLYFTSSHIDITNETAVREEFRDLNFRLQEANLRLMESARLDSLTGCLNRGAFLDEAAKAMQIDTRYGRSSTLVFFDLNDFKQINDSFGHHIGDRALVGFAEQIRARLRNTDELGRYGGDEFIALLRETDAEQARSLIETLTPVVVETEDGHSLIVRYSAGIATIDDPAITSIDDWIRIADHEMYEQKLQRGRR